MAEFMACDAQVSFLKGNGLEFNNITITQACEMLMHDVYYHKIVSYKEYFSHHTVDSKGNDSFVGIDFSDLYELHQLDKLLKEIFNDITLDIENSFKVFIMRYVETKDFDEYFYYKIADVERKYRINAKMEKRIRDYNDTYSSKQLKRYPDLKPIWVLNEYLAFGEVLELFVTHLKRTKNSEYDQIIKFLYQAKLVRNLTAHGNHLFVKHSTKQDSDLLLIDCYMQDFNIKINPNKLTSTFIVNMLSSIYIYKKLAVKSDVFEKLNELFLAIHTFSKNKKLFVRHPNEQFTLDVLYLMKVINKLY